VITAHTDFHTDVHPAGVVWASIADLAPQARTWIDVGMGHGGPFMEHERNSAGVKLDRRCGYDAGPLMQPVPGWELIQGDVREALTLFGPKSWDVVVCAEAWEHFDWWGAMYAPQDFLAMARLAVVLATTDETGHPRNQESNQRAFELKNHHQRFQRRWQEHESAFRGYTFRVHRRGTTLMAVWRADGRVPPGWADVESPWNDPIPAPLAENAVVRRAEWSAARGWY